MRSDCSDRILHIVIRSQCKWHPVQRDRILKSQQVGHQTLPRVKRITIQLKTLKKEFDRHSA